MDSEAGMEVTVGGEEGMMETADTAMVAVVRAVRVRAVVVVVRVTV